MNIKYWTNFSKRKNSTKQPTGGTTKAVVLKEETSLDNPVFIVDEPTPAWTYVQAFGDYYFVTDIVNLDAHRAEVHCTEDVLATFKSDINGYSCFVERSQSEYDEFLIDPLLSARQYIRDESTTSTPISVFGSGCYIAEVMTKDHGITLYATGSLNPYKALLMPSTYQTADITDWIDSKIAQAFDLDVYIGSIKWVPFDASSIGELTNTFYVGPVDVGVSISTNIYRVPNNHYIRSTQTLTLDTNNLFNDFRDCSPKFTQYSIRLPGVGIADLDPAVVGSCIHESRAIHLDIDIDLVSGDVVYTLSTGTNRVGFARYKGNIAVNVPIGKSVSDMSNTLTMVAGGAGATASGYAMGGVAGAAIAGAVSLVNVIDNIITPQTSMIGGSGNKADLLATRAYVHIIRRQYGTKAYPIYNAGRPLCRNVQLSTLSGFIKCGSASVPINGKEFERDQINSYLNSGFYLE